MSSEASTDVLAVEEAQSTPPVASRLLWTIAKNLFALGLGGALLLAYETGYFSNDRISRGDWVSLYEFPKDKPGKPLYDAVFTADMLTKVVPAGRWDVYNQALPETVSVVGDAMVMKYSLAWLGVYFDHTGFEPKALYRVRFEAKVDNEPAAILMRNRQLDYMRNVLPTTGGEFKEFTADYAAPAGRYDQVKVIFMPNGRDKVSGSLTIRKFRIERLEK